MADIAKVKRNVAKMASMNAPEEDIDGYIASEGLTVDDIRNFKGGRNVEETPQPQSAIGKVADVAFSPIAKTLTGKSLSGRLEDATAMKNVQNNYDLYGNNPVSRIKSIAENTMQGTIADLAEGFTAPAAIVGGLASKIPAVQQAGKAIANSPIGQKIGSVLNKPLTGTKALEDKIFNLYNKTIGSAKIRNLADTNKIKTERLTAVKTIQENADNLKFPDENTGEMISRLPSNRFEQAQALRQTKINVWDEVERMSGGATNSGATIDMNVVVDKALQNTLRSIGDDAFKANPRLLRSILKEANNVRGIKTTNPTRAEEYMKSLNDELKTFRQSGQVVNYSVIDFKNNLIHTLNQATDDAIEKALSQSGYSAQRAKYSALKSVEKEMIGAANKFLKQEAGGGGGIAHPLVDFWSLEEFMYGSGQMLMGNVSGGAKTMARGALLKTASKVSDYFRSPDRSMKKMYELIGKSKNTAPWLESVSGLSDDVGDVMKFYDLTNFKRGDPGTKVLGIGYTPRYIQERALDPIPSLGVKGNSVERGIPPTIVSTGIPVPAPKKIGYIEKYIQEREFGDIPSLGVKGKPIQRGIPTKETIEKYGAPSTSRRVQTNQSNPSDVKPILDESYENAIRSKQKRMIKFK